MNSEYMRAFEKIKLANSIAILPHKDADGDALGAAFGLKLALVSMGKSAVVILEAGDTHKLLAMVKGFEVLTNNEQRITNNDGRFAAQIKFDLAIAIDSADLGRLGRRAEFFQSMGEATIAFDHHQSFSHFADVNILEDSCGACAEIIYKFLAANGIEITPEIAHNLYLGISSDTGGFRQANTTPQSMDIGAELMRRGANYGEINTAIFMSDTLKYTKFLGEVLSNLRMFHNNEIAVLYATQELLEKYGDGDESKEGIVNFAQNIIGVKVGFFLRVKERDDGERYIKVSARANFDEYNVAEICKNFGGGGHIRAAGGEIRHADMERAIAEVVGVAGEFIDEIDKNLNE